MKAFRKACFYGIPDEPGLRSTAWKVLLGYLPPDKRMWASVLKSQRLNYYNWVKDLLEEPAEEPPSSDYPLNDEMSSKWTSFFADNSTLEQIDKDVRRTLPDFAFFQLHVSSNPLNPLCPPPHQKYYTIEEYDSDHTITPEDLAYLEKDTKTRRFSFGLKNRPRSSSTTSRKSLKLSSHSTTATASNNNAAIKTRARADSRSSVRSFSSGIIETSSDIISTPRNLVRKLSSAFIKSNHSSNLLPKFGNSKKHALLFQHSIEPICSYIPTRRSLFNRIAHLSDETGNREHEQSTKTDDHISDYHWEVIERILYIYAKLNPGVGYVQGMNELLAPIYYVFAAKMAEDDLESQAYAEADAFFVFTTLMSDVRDHFVRSLDLDASMGINATMWRMNQRLAWFDYTLYRDLSKKDVKEQYYAFRWITVLCSQEWDLPDVIRLWDSILADRGMQEEGKSEDERFEFLLDFSVAMLVCIRQDLMKGDFGDNMRVLQNYPIDDIQVVFNSAYAIREARLLAVLSGKVIPGVSNDKRSSGLFNADWSDTSSMSSTNSSRLKKLRDTTGMARASIDSFRKGSKDSLDELFRRSLSITRHSLDDSERKRVSTGDTVTRSLSQKLGFGNSLASKVRRTASVRTAEQEQIHRDWILANQLNESENKINRSNSLINRFSQMVSGNPVSPYRSASQRSTQVKHDIDSANNMSSAARAYRSFV
ncbi:rab-GTPase-TBC domain-containing protein [Sporodiniella umbellata]|nr:rab-GTPase-TBC domain-containing protein [Sporodiniella umbellata]